MKHIAAILLVFATVASGAEVVLNWTLPLYTKEGYHSMTARGDEMRPTGEDQYEVVNLTLIRFRGDATNAVEDIILSPAATFLSRERIARGDKFVRFIGDDIEATGKRWIYRQKEKKISLDGEVRVTFGAELKNLLK